jgi:predicted acylesterase/phospholipase RssA
MICLRIVVAAAMMVALSGCGTFAYYNRPAEPGATAPAGATFNVQRDRGAADVLVLLALSGGGSRAAYFSGNVMLRLQHVFPDLDILQEVDVISSVSGGSLPAAYYAISRDAAVRLAAPPPPALLASGKLRYEPTARTLALTDRLTDQEATAARAALGNDPDRRQFDRLVKQQAVPSNRTWDAPTVRDLMSRNYIARWIGNWFWPDNILLYWFTAYDRSDIMAQTFADNLYDVFPTGRDLTFRDLNPERPTLILNATNGTEKVDSADRGFGSVFTFTEEDFASIRSDLGAYPVARAVMASASFPVVFNYMTLRNFSADTARYLHTFDGGNSDNLGLTSLKRILLDERVNRPGRFRRVVLIIVDSYIRSKGVDRDEPDGRCAFCYVADMNAVDAVDALLAANRANLVEDLREGSLDTKKDCAQGNLPREVCENPRLEAQVEQVRNQLFVFHVKFEDSRLREKLEQIPTHFRITDDRDGRSNSVYLDGAAEELISPESTCLGRIYAILTDPSDKGRGGVEYCP